jgi:hypothetical protein
MSCSLNHVCIFHFVNFFSNESKGETHIHLVHKSEKYEFKLAF